MKTILGILHLVLVIWAVLNIVQSSASGVEKVLWSLGVLVFPLVGLIVWYLAGPKSA